MSSLSGERTFPKKGGSVKTTRYFDAGTEKVDKKATKKILKKKKKVEGGSSKVAPEMKAAKAGKPEKSIKKKKKKAVKGDPVKDTSVEYRSLATEGDSDGDDDVMDVADMFEGQEGEEEDTQIPTINSGKRRKLVVGAGPLESVATEQTSDNLQPDSEQEDSDAEPMEHSDGSEDEGEEDQEEQLSKQFRQDMANLPLSKVREMKEKLGIKLFNKAYFGTTEEDKKRDEKKLEDKKKEAEQKRGQHRPKEISSKKKVSSFRNLYPSESIAKKKWDPRFDERCGQLKEWCFDDNYQFLEGMRGEEKEELRRALAESIEAEDHERAERITQAVRRMENQERTRQEKKLKQDTMKEIREENIDRMMQGDRPQFKTKAEVRMRVMEKKFDQLKDENKLDKYLKRKSKKDAQKSKKSKPAAPGSAFERQYGYQ